MANIAKIAGVAVANCAKFAGRTLANGDKIAGVTASLLSPWSTWDEQSQDTFDTADGFLCMFDNTSAGGDDVGTGLSLTGADATLTQVGTVAGATGTPPSRVLSGSGQYFTAAAAILAAALNGRNTYSLIMKVSLDNTAERGIVTASGCINSWIQVDTGKMRVDLTAGGSLIINGATADAFSTGINYLCFWGDGTSHKAGFCTSKPTKLSDFAAGKVQSASSSGTLSYSGSATLFDFGGVAELDGNVYYALFSTKCLINNAA